MIRIMELTEEEYGFVLDYVKEQPEFVQHEFDWSLAFRYNGLEIKLRIPGLVIISGNPMDGDELESEFASVIKNKQWMPTEHRLLELKQDFIPLRINAQFDREADHYSLDWWEYNHALASISFWGDGQITFYKVKKGECLVDEKFDSLEEFDAYWETYWKNLVAECKASDEARRGKEND